MKAFFVIDGIRVRLQDGIRAGQPVVAIVLLYGPESPIHYFQVDKPMLSASAAAELVSSANNATAQQLVDEILRTEGALISSVNRVFGASDNEAAIAYAKLGSKENEQYFRRRGKP